MQSLSAAVDRERIDASVLTVRFVTELGTEVVRTYSSPEDLARAVTAALPEDETQRLLADVRASEHAAGASGRAHH